MPVPILLQIQTAKRYLRRKYPVDQLPQLKTLADTTFAEATDTVTLTSNSFEGGSASGEITFDKTVLLTAIEELIAEVDPTAPEEAPSSVLLDYSSRQVQA